MSAVVTAPRHSVLVRVTHWTTTLGFAGLLVSGMAILLAHPRLYWGDTGAVGGPSLLDLPLPFMLTGQSSWGRSPHFLPSWICVTSGIVYVAAGVVTRHFHTRLFAADHAPAVYSALQRRAYAVVVFVLFPLMIWTGLAMSPAITSVAPAIVTGLGGHQSARTMHFFVAAAMLLFVIGHVTMVCVNGLTTLLGAMITGRLNTPEART